MQYHPHLHKIIIITLPQSSFFTYWGKALTIPSIIWFSTWSTALIIFFKIISSFKEIIYHWDYVPITTLILISIISLLHKSVNWFYAFLKIFWITIHILLYFFQDYNRVPKTSFDTLTLYSLIFSYSEWWRYKGSVKSRQPRGCGRCQPERVESNNKRIWLSWYKQVRLNISGP